MKIDEYLKNSPIFVLLHAQQAVQQELQKLLLDEQVNFLQALTLITILLEGHQQQPVTPSALVKAFNCSKARLSQMLTYLESQAWLYRSLTLSDARSHTLNLTASGMAKANRLIKCVDRLEQELEESMEPSSLQALTLHLRTLGSALRCRAD